MIEDALKSARTLHRLIMTVALVTIVFSLSISLPTDKTRQKELIDGLIGTDFKAYLSYVETLVAAEQAATLKPIGDALSASLESGDHLIFNLGAIGDAIAKPLHIGRILVEDLNLNDVANASIASLNALNGLSLDKNVQILVPRTDELEPEIRSFLSENGGAGKRVDEVRFSIDDFGFVAETFLPGDEHFIGSYFEVLDGVRIGGAPVFSASFLGDVKELPNSSLLNWMKAQGFDEDLVSISDDEISFATELAGAPSGFLNEKLGVLSLRLGDEIAQSGPARQSVSILGTSVPGTLVIFASPLILFALSYYFLSHTAHLSRICEANEADFDQFAWLPLSHKAAASIKVTKRWGISLSAGLFEALSSGVLLPAAAIALLYGRLSQFGNLTDLQVACMAASALGVVCFGLLAMARINRIREHLSAWAEMRSGGAPKADETAG